MAKRNIAGRGDSPRRGRAVGRTSQPARPDKPGPVDFVEPGGEDELSRELVLELFAKVRRPLNLDALLRMLGVRRRAKKRLDGILAELTASGDILRLRGGSYGLMQNLKLITGILRVQRSGAGFVDPEDGGQSLFIPPASMGDAWHGDTVAAARVPGTRAHDGLHAEGRIARVLRRGAQTLPLTALRRSGEKLLASPADARIQAHFLVEGTDVSAIPYGALLVAEPGEKLEHGLWAAKLVSVLGEEGSVAAQEQIVKLTHGVPGAFPQGVLDEAARLPASPTEHELSEQAREDVRHIPFVTIDGADARDFDDAIHVEALADGWLLRVAIADVSYYVRPGSALDKEARERGNSWYFPASVEPMLPEALCNGLCSLRPDEPRLAMVAELRFGADGRRLGERFYSAAIRSRARLVYEDVSALLGPSKSALPPHEAGETGSAGRPGKPDVPGEADAGIHTEFATCPEGCAANVPDEHAAMLRRAEILAAKLRERRVERGSLDFNVPEARVVFDEAGAISGIVPRASGVSNHIIEECMLAANEAVARFLHDRSLPVLYRVHPAPDPEKLSGFFETLKATGLVPGIKRGGSALLQRLLAEPGSAQQQFIIRRLALRTMMQARYSAERERHFGLAAEYYCHFTSPIRRYADLTVHRALRKALGLPVYGDVPDAARLERIANGINMCERAAVDAERELYRRLSVLYLRDKIGEVYEGVISGVLDFGFFVECANPMAEGMVRLSSVMDDYFRYDPVRQELLGERSGRAFRLGQSVTVEVQEVNMARLEINFILADEEYGDGRQGARRGMKHAARTQGMPGRKNGRKASSRGGDVSHRKSRNADRGGGKKNSARKVEKGAVRGRGASRTRAK